jgi:hypothetical protein
VRCCVAPGNRFPVVTVWRSYISWPLDLN